MGWKCGERVENVEKNEPFTRNQKPDTPNNTQFHFCNDFSFEIQTNTKFFKWFEEKEKLILKWSLKCRRFSGILHCNGIQPYAIFIFNWTCFFSNWIKNGATAVENRKVTFSHYTQELGTRKKRWWLYGINVFQ